MSNIINFLSNVSGNLYAILSEDILPGVSLFTVFFYSLLASCFFSVFTRR